MSHSDIMITADHMAQTLGPKCGYGADFFRALALALSTHRAEREVAVRQGRTFHGKSDAGYIHDLMLKSGVEGIEIDDVIRVLK